MTEKRSIRSYPAVAARASRAEREEQGDWEIVISGDLTDKQSDLVDKLVGVPRRSRGTIFFDSCGGSTYVGLTLAALIRLRGLEAQGVVAGECSSAALFPFAACRERYVLPYSTLLFHPIRWQSDESVRVEEAAEWSRHFQEMEPALDDLLAQMFPLPIETLNTWTRPGRFVTGKELADAGLATLVDMFSGDVWRQAQQKSTRQ
jgi:ATP-dependent protease ClpP protease subunit